MATLTVGPTSTFPSIAAAMLAGAPADTILLETGYSNESATVTHNGMTVSGGATSTGIVLQLAVGIPTFFLGGSAPINVLANASGGNGITGNAGDNVVTVTGGIDAVDGGLGTDRLIVDYRLATGAVTGNSTSNFSEAGGGGRSVTITDGTIEHFSVLTGAGADTLTVGNGNNGIDAGNGANTITAGDGQNTITGGLNTDTITAGNGGNAIDAGDGTNTVTSGFGADVIVTGTGADTIIAGGGNDVIIVRGGADSVDSGAGADRLIVDYSAMTTDVNGGVTGGNFLTGYTGHIADVTVSTLDFVGTDFITTGDGVDLLTGGAGIDHLEGGAGADVLDGGTGVDFADYRTSAGGVLANLLTPGDNTGDAAGDSYTSIEGLVGSAFADVLRIGNGGSSIYAGAGNDYLLGGDGVDDLHGGDGIDHLLGGAGADILDGGTGVDFANYATAAGGVLANLLTPADNSGEAAGDSFTSIEGLVGSAFADVLRIGNGGSSIYANAGNDFLFGGDGGDDLHGGDGIDHLLGGVGADILDGGHGVDYADYMTAASGVLVNLLTPSDNVGDAAGDTFVSIEGLIGSAFNDVLRLGEGNGTVYGNQGDDTLFSGSGVDMIVGGIGNDAFVFVRGQGNGDTIEDFSGNGAGAGDSLLFSGYGTAAEGATFTQVDATHWSINSWDGAVHDVLTFTGGPTIDISDYLLA